MKGTVFSPERRIGFPVLSILLGILSSVIVFFPVGAAAKDTKEEEEAGKTVVVGWYESPFNQTDRFGRRSGYAYEYQQMIAAFTGWNYEYVEGSWPDLYQMLLDGKIDLLSDVSYTEERAEKILYPAFPMGSEEYYVYVSPQGSRGIEFGDYLSLNGKRIGVNRGSVQKDLFLEWSKKNGISAQIVELARNEDEIIEMLDQGELDAYISIDSFRGFRGMVPICKIRSSDYYFAVKHSRQDLLIELEQAMNSIQSENIYYNQQLQEKYISSSEANMLLSQSELDWVWKHGAVKVGYRDDYLAFCAQDRKTGGKMRRPCRSHRYYPEP